MIQQAYEIKATAGDVWEALTDPTTIQEWSGDIAVMGDGVGSTFDLWSGEIWGTNTAVETNKLLEQDWYGGDWDKPSKVTIELSESDGVTIVTLTHINVSSAEEENFKNGWRGFCFIPM
ncbi:ATPase [candidate division WWE3 bacterium CG_4_10_14_0_2_um_filter_41_14]|uniref:ATPase n=1 Tax=candidate division WWE3 bacterium CG_4_10_14_0_2_um_filter_41_14 TaxID=1975072 RepID=A0A2M7TLV7_UNCKA|nr:MAG: ATPase [candidate division WWE3 bacterium CG_4_10_14_0_2_um_filter_41_14]